MIALCTSTASAPFQWLATLSSPRCACNQRRKTQLSFNQVASHQTLGARQTKLASRRQHVGLLHSVTGVSIPPSRLGYQDLADQILCCPSPWSQNGCKLEARNRAPARTTLADAFPFAIREAEVRIQDELQEVVGVVRVKWQRSTQTGHTQLLVLN
jgi:hypothetical protein